MSRVLFYKKGTGLFHTLVLVTDSDAAIAANTPEGHAAIEGDHDPLCHRFDVETGTVIGYQPPAPSADHVWDGKRWGLSPAARAKAESARINIARRGTLIEQQHEWVRHLLLDPQDAAARTTLQAIHDELQQLRGADALE